MRVLHVIDALGVGGGAEHALATMLPMLRDRGVDSNVAVLTPREDGLQQQLVSQGFGVEVLDGRSSPAKIRALRRKVRKELPELVHATLFNSCIATRFACKGLPVRQVNSLVNTSYDPVRLSELGISRWKLKTMQLFDSITARLLGDHFHVLTDAVALEATEILHIRPSRLTKIPRGRSTDILKQPTNEQLARTRMELGVDRTTPLVLNIGRQDRQKAQVDLVRAFGLLMETHPDAMLFIAGRNGDASKELRQAIDEVGARERIELLGHRTDIPDLLAVADVFAFPSHYEGLGSVLIEAMAMGTAIVASDAPAIAEVLADGRCGLVVQRGDVCQLADSISKLLSDPNHRALLSDLGRQRFFDQYEIHQIVDRTFQMYVKLCE